MLYELPKVGTPLGSLMSQLAEAFPHQPAVTCDGTTLDRATLDAWANRLARVFADRGVGLGDLVTIALHNSPEFVATVLASWELGSVPQPVSSKLPLQGPPLGPRVVTAVTPAAAPASRHASVASPRTVEGDGG